MRANSADTWSQLITEANVYDVDPAYGFMYNNRRWRPAEILINFGLEQTGVLAAGPDSSLKALPLDVIPYLKPFKEIGPEAPLGYMATMHQRQISDQSREDSVRILRISDGLEPGALPTEIRFGEHPELPGEPSFFIGTQQLGRATLDLAVVEFFPPSEVSFDYFPIPRN